ncbi:MAG: Flp pilus assembly complex ATPase component TadA [Candidatus Aenigmarchaeota archaeon]|nr:Flp pilus assembly complex ATPase component TadA [Candidatus Aenigmarchaeota archaeon]
MKNKNTNRKISQNTASPYPNRSRGARGSTSTSKAKIIVPDTSVLVSKKLSRLIESGKLKDKQILIPNVVIDELQAQASTGRDIGFSGLEEIKKIRELGKKKKIKVDFTGKRPTFEEIRLARKGRLDALIRDVAKEMNATLLTSDYVQALVGEAEGVSVDHIPSGSSVMNKEFALEKYFTNDTQSVHLKAGAYPVAKRGKPGEVILHKIGKNKITEDDLKKLGDQIVSRSRVMENSFMEISRKGAVVIQLGNYRIAITKPPFSNATEITAVRPIAKVSIEDYELHKEIENRILDRSSGVLVSGPPGSGKSTFTASLAEFIDKKGKIVKTFEQPRDLQVGDSITQYAPLEGDWEKAAEILLLVRPDYTVFDEVRKTRDFKIFSDMRLAGVGMVGVVHATNPVDAIQRFLGRVELGVIPHIIDTVIFIEAGKIESVLELSLTVKVPSGMVEADLSRPVVEVRDFETKKLVYEIYSYGEETIMIPVKEAKSPVNDLAKQSVEQFMSKYDPSVEVEIISADRAVVKVNENVIARLIGKQGKNIDEIEKQLGIHLSVEPKSQTLKQEIPWHYEESGAHILIRIANEFIGEQVDVYSGDDFIFSPYVGKKGLIKVKKKSELGKKVLHSVVSKRLKVLV